jgi:hypothetical protein
MSPSSVEYLLCHQSRLLARRESPVIDKELEDMRQAALEIFYQWQDGLAPVPGSNSPLLPSLRRRST